MKTSARIAAVVLASAVIVPAVSADPAATGSDTYPTLIWNRVALETIERAKPTQHMAVRLLTHVSLAQHAAIVESATPEAARTAVASASIGVITGMFPAHAKFVEDRSRAIGAVESEHGARIAQRVLAQAGSDGFSLPWTGQVPQGANTWRSLAQPAAAPAYPAIGSMRPLLLENGSAVRPAAPPEIGSVRFADDLAQVRRHVLAPTEESIRLARFYDMTSGTMAGGFWNEQAHAVIRESRADERKATVVLATVNAAMMDALVACHDAKYAYWVPRPSQIDPQIKALIGVPNHPSYPSNHSCLSTAAGQVLAHFFPSERGRMEGFSTEAGLSRIYAGLHYRFDVEAGEAIGRAVANAAITRHPQMLARFAQTQLSGF